MRKNKGLIIALTIGIICAVCLIYVGFNSDKVGKNYTLEDYELKEFAADASDYSKLSINVESTDVEVITSDTNQVKISYYNMDKDFYTVSTTGGEIKMTYTNEISSWIFGYSIPIKKVTVELPKTVNIEMDFNVKYGDVILNEINTDKELKVNTDSASVKIRNVNPKKMDIMMKYGELVMENVQSETIESDTNSVSVSFSEIDINHINMVVKYGSVTGSFLGNSNDYTVTGDVKDGESNLSDFKGNGNKTVHIQGDSADISIGFTE